MIQRIQSLWLLLSALSILILSQVPIYYVTLSDGTAQNLMTGERFFTTILALLLIILPIITLFLFRNRTAQKKLIWLHILLNLLLLLFFWIAKDSFIDTRALTISSSTYGLGIGVPLLSIILDVMAFRGVRADEKLIKAADKFR